MSEVVKGVTVTVSGEDRGASATLRKVAEAEKALAAEAKASLQVQAQAGNEAAKAQLQLLQVQEKFAARRQSLEKLANGQTYGPEPLDISTKRASAAIALERLKREQDDELFRAFVAPDRQREDEQFAQFLAEEKRAAAAKAAADERAAADFGRPVPGVGGNGPFAGIKGLQRAMEAAGVSFAGQALAKAADKAADFATALREGEKSAADMASDFLRGLPIIGGWAQAGASLRELFTGEAAAVKQINADAERTTKVIEFQAQVRREADDRHLATLKEIRALEQGASLVGVGGPGAEAAGARFAASNSAADLAQQIKDQERAIREQFDKDSGVAELKKQLQAAEKAAETPNYLLQQGIDPSKLSKRELDAVQRAKDLAAQLKTVETNRQAAIDAGTKDLRDKQAAEQKKANAEFFQAMGEGNVAREKATRETNDKIAATNSQARQKELENQGKSLDAINEQYDRALKDQLAKDRQAAADKAAALTPGEFDNDPNRFNQAKFAIFAAEKQQEAVDARLNAAEKAAAVEANTNAQIDHRLGVEHQLADLRINSLRAEAEAGKSAAKVEADRLAVAEQFKQQREQILRTLREDKQLSDEQRRALNQALGGLDLQEAQALARAAFPQASGIGLAQNIQTFTGSGISLFAQAQAEAARMEAEDRRAAAEKARIDAERAMENNPHNLAAGAEEDAARKMDGASGKLETAAQKLLDAAAALADSILDAF